MNTPHHEPPLDPPDRLRELLADHALFGLDEAERAELQQLRADDRSEPDDLIRLAAELQLALLPADLEPLPPHVARKLAGAIQAARPDPVVAANRARRLPWLTIVLSAACLALLALRLVEPDRAPISPAISAAVRRTQLLEQAPDALQLDWTATGEAHGPHAAGDLVWSASRQEGYLRFRNLQVNDPRIEQYQLWIFDEQQDERYPIDGGVFDITAEGEVIIPIRAALRVSNPTLFAITVEKPGGVVVSDRSRLPLLAKVGNRQG
ncbi:MAG: anti-sigma factor domain-containing protein [Blastocatellia bacterium]